MSRTSHRHVESQVRPGRRLYRNTDDAILFGVCAGIGDFFGIPAWGVRILTILLTIFTSGVPIIIYLVLPFVIPELPLEDELTERSAHRKYRPRQSSPRGAGQTENSSGHIDDDQHSSVHSHMDSVKNNIDLIQERVSVIETYITSGRFDLDKEFRNLN